MTDKLKMSEMLQQQITAIVNEAALNALDENGRCWSGYEPVPGKTPFSKGSCRKISETNTALPIVKKNLGLGFSPKSD